MYGEIRQKPRWKRSSFGHKLAAKNGNQKKEEGEMMRWLDKKAAGMLTRDSVLPTERKETEVEKTFGAPLAPPVFRMGRDKPDR